MSDETGATLSSSAADVGPPKSSWRRRLGVIAAFLLVGLIAVVSPAAAAPPTIVTPTTDVPPIGRWVSGDAVIAVPELFGPTTAHSDRANEPVEVDCVGGPAGAKVRGYFGSGDGLVTGWTSAKNVTTRGWTPPPCGIGDYAAFAW